LCKRCAVVRGAQIPARGLSAVPDGPAFDPAAELRLLAARMAEAHRVDPGNAILGAELRKTLVELIGKRAEKPDDDLAGLFSALQA
jgi:hypothetical protein